MIVQYKMVSRVQYSHVISCILQIFPPIRSLDRLARARLPPFDLRDMTMRPGWWNPTGIQWVSNWRFILFPVFPGLCSHFWSSGVGKGPRRKHGPWPETDFDLKMTWERQSVLGTEHHWQIHQLSTGRWPDDPMPTGSGDHLLFEARAEKAFMRGFSRIIRDPRALYEDVRRVYACICAEMCRIRPAILLDTDHITRVWPHLKTFIQPLPSLHGSLNSNSPHVEDRT